MGGSLGGGRARAGAAAACAWIAAGAACEDAPYEPVPTLLARGFEVPEVPTDAAVLDLEYVLPVSFVPPDGHRLAATATLAGPDGLAEVSAPDLEAADGFQPDGEPGQVAAFWLPELGAEEPQDALEGEHGRKCSFSLVFSATDEGSVSLTLAVFDVGPDDLAGAWLEDIQFVRLVFHGGDEEAEVTS